MICGKCSNNISDTAKFCSQCGWVLIQLSEKEKEFLEYERKYLDRLSGKETTSNEINPISEKVEAVEPITSKQVSGWLSKVAFFIVAGIITGVIIAALGM